MKPYLHLYYGWRNWCQIGLAMCREDHRFHVELLVPFLRVHTGCSWSETFQYQWIAMRVEP